MKLGRVLGLAKNYSNEMAQWILTDTMNLILRGIYRPLTKEEKRNYILKQQMDKLMTKVCQHYSGKLKVSKESRASPTVETVVRNRMIAN